MTATATDAPTGPALRIGAATYPVVLPRLSDSRLHVAGVIVTLHVLGQVALNFRVSVPQILSAIGSCALIELVVTFVRRRAIVWPASAMLTGSGVGLILRDTTTQAGDHWTFEHWWLFAGIASLSLASKYLVRWHGSHVFNPSNLGLVVAFLVLGSDRIEPLDFWWGPFGLTMLVAYWVILAGGLIVTDRLRLLELATAFWAGLAVCMAALALAGHCITTPWSAEPVCDWHFWWIIMTSPELAIFAFFMISDPRTVPSGRRERVIFGLAVAAVSSVLIASRPTEFGAKVGLLGGLVVVCGARPVVTTLRPLIDARRQRPASARLALVSCLCVPIAVALAGQPARTAASAVAVAQLPEPAVYVATVDPSRVPPLAIDPDVAVFGEAFLGDDAYQAAIEIVRALDVEAMAFDQNDLDLLAVVDHGARLAGQRAAMADTHGPLVWHDRHAFTSMELTVERSSGQGGLRLAFVVTGVADEVTRLDDGQTQRRSVPIEAVYLVRQGSDGRWLIIDERPVNHG